MLLSNTIHIVDLGLMLGLLITIGTAAYKYGKLSQRVTHLEDDAGEYMKQESFKLFRDEILRRLDRIDNAISNRSPHA